MENKDFDKIFSHKFGQLPGEPYREEGWSDLSNRLYAHERRRRRWLLPLVLPLLGLLTAGNVFWWYQWRQAASDSSAASLSSTVYQTDTIVQKTVVYRYDTVYQHITLVRRQYAGDLAPTKPSPDAGAPFSEFTNNNNAGKGIAAIETPQPGAPALPGQESRENPPGQVAPASQNAANQPIIQENTPAPQRTIVHKVPVPESAAPEAQALTIAPPSVPDSTFEQPVETRPITKKSRSNLLFAARPRIGLVAGWGNPLLRHKRSGSLLGAGIAADVEIVRNVRLGVEAQYWQGKLKADELQEDDEEDDHNVLRGIKVPDPGSDYKLKYWETYRLPALTYVIQLRYQLPLRSAWSPWFGVGAQAATTLPFEIEFDFENEKNNLEITLAGQSKAMTHWQGMLFMLGVEGQLGPHFSLGAGGYWLMPFGEERRILDNQVGLKTHLFYNF